MNSPHSSSYWNGRLIGDKERYRIDRPLAVGGMGEVLLATDTRVGQQVVLKLLKDTLVASQEMRKRFEREVAICAALQSDHIVKISDCGVTPEGYPFYVMEYLRGQTLRQLLVREQRLSVERTASIISQVCQGLQLAHQGVTLQKNGSNEHIQVIHRDLKPDNIFLVPTDLGEWVKILDFGVAKIRNDTSEQTNLTNTFIGTFRYAAPEQIQNQQNLDARADIYSLGIILYEMLSAVDPFGFSMKAHNVSETSWILAHAYEPPIPLRSQPGCEQLSAAIEDVVLKCLQKNPNHRFASVAELNQALRDASHSATDNTTAQHKPNIVHPQLTFHQETISKPLYPVETSQAVYNQGSNHETVTKLLHPEAAEPAEGIILQPCPSPHPADNHETVTKLLHPEAAEPPEQTILQPRPSPEPKSSHETVTKLLHPEAAEPAEETILQPRPSPEPKPSHETVTKLLHPEAAEPAEETILQPRPSPEPKPSHETVTKLLHPEADETLLQPSPPKLAIARNSQIFGQNRWIGLAIILAFFAGMSIFYLQTNQGSKNSPTVPNSTQK
ncbi:serine/threonine protein kinase [Nostoc sp. PCC 7524]|uniref:serine/threonine protein kinase n=1 Tax=Nostoc sp. (strain ATCC 29411 / PCC 7524) TaxID=28072 RepID=UPI00029EE9D6|nr:protein kinase [Nostoc sp. PCC 7524]AFY49767.1 serine/threonine protein kinase [Nostoc sp. PCC 7524]